MKLNKKLCLIMALGIIFMLVVTGCSQAASAPTPTPIVKEVVKEVMVTPPPAEPSVPKYVFYLIGDGLGASQRQVAEYYKQHATGTDAKLAMNTLPVAGINTTYSLDTLVTDSAAAGTALSAGVKTNNGCIAMTPDGTKTTTLIEAVQDIGLATGIVTSTRLTHATPAAFATHNITRSDENGIAVDYLDCNVDFIAGGGIRHFLPSSYEAGEKDSMGSTIKSKREDERDLLSEFESNGYKVFAGSQGTTDLNAYTPQAGDKVFAPLTYSHMPYEVDRANANTDLPSLSELTETAISLLEKDEDGFMLMVEAGRIDHACHPNDVVGAIYDTLEFDEVISVALDFYNAHPNDTLIIVVGDHETGGMGLGFATDYFLNLDRIDGVKGSFEGSYGFAYSSEITREDYYSYLESLGITDLTEEEIAYLETAMDMTDSEEFHVDNGYQYNEAGLAVNSIISQRVGVEWTTYAHTGTQIPFGVIGAGEKNFGGYMDNTDIAKALADILSVDIG